MTPDEIIELAREAGFTDGMVSIVGAEGFANFARLVAAAERKAAWEAVNALIVPGDIGGNGTDPTAQRNGIVLAANVLMSRIGGKND